MISPRCGPSPTRMPLRSGNVAAGMTRSASAMIVGVMNRSTDMMKSHLLNALYTRRGAAPMQAMPLVVWKCAPWIS